MGNEVDMIQEFEAVLVMDFANVTEQFQRLRGVRNRLNRQGQEANRKAEVGRGNIFSDGGPLKVQRTGNGKAQKVQPPQNVTRKEVPVDAAMLQRMQAQKGQMGQAMECNEVLVDAVALQRLNISDATSATPGDPPSDSDDDMHEFDGAKVTPVSSALVTSAAKELEKKVQAFRGKENCWVLDTGCGYKLTGHSSVFVAKEPNTDYGDSKKIFYRVCGKYCLISTRQLLTIRKRMHTLPHSYTLPTST
ncbi:hypothetical protein GN958_ATG23642 [Phytophthora infestans]|uniref:Uncharacterized protein n=1 Tax=Phytophthora infestans TaxID=4787 RepID=A0A8S9THK3_PHYIN|nr:hypothetical protein GN958_ATG23642 [Phytophthora infestans]